MWRDLSRLVDIECTVMVHGFTLKHFSGIFVCDVNMPQSGTL